MADYAEKSWLTVWMNYNSTIKIEIISDKGNLDFMVEYNLRELGLSGLTSTEICEKIEKMMGESGQPEQDIGKLHKQLRIKTKKDKVVDKIIVVEKESRLEVCNKSPEESAVKV